jgi:UDP-glucose 4-epimerase
MSELAELLLEITGSDVGVEYRPHPAGALPARRVGDPKRAEEILGFRAKTSLRDGVRRLVEWRRRALATTRASEATA